MSDELIWYVAYGSNVSATRLQTYLDRHARRAGLERSAPRASSPVSLPHRLFFAHESLVWTGGTAFLDPVVDPGETTLGRAWLLPRSSFLGVMAQENRREVLAADAVVFDLGIGDTAVVDHRRYGLALGCESPDGRPALTFTTPESPLPEPNTPTERYLTTIVDGLVDGHGIDRGAAMAYVRARIST